MERTCGFLRGIFIRFQLGNGTFFTHPDDTMTCEDRDVDLPKQDIDRVLT